MQEQSRFLIDGMLHCNIPCIAQKCVIEVNLAMAAQIDMIEVLATCLASW